MHLPPLTPYTTVSGPIPRFMAAFVAVALSILLSTGAITDVQCLFFYTLLLLVYLYVECSTVYRGGNRLFWLNPVVMASVFTFVLGFGITNFIYSMPIDILESLKLTPVVTPWMNKVMLLVILGACAMWAGYASKSAAGLVARVEQSKLLKRLIVKSVRVNRPVIYASLAISLVARLIEIKLGVYGYSADYDQLISGAAYREYLSMAESLGKLALVAAAIQCFASVIPTWRDRALLFVITLYEVVFGFLGGFKSQVVMPVVILAIVHYSQRNRFPRWFIPVAVISLLAAYAVIEPFRKARVADVGFVGTDISNIASTMATAKNNASVEMVVVPSPVLSILSRLNLTWIASLGVEYADKHKLPPGSPNFMVNILLSPAYAVIPRAIWPGKPLETTGLWYTNEVMGLDIVSATGMSPFTYLYFAGGTVAVLIGFFVVGVVQRGLFEGLVQFGGGGMIIFLGLLQFLGTIDSVFTSFLMSIIRYAPALIIAQYFILDRSALARKIN